MNLRWMTTTLMTVALPAALGACQTEEPDSEACMSFESWVGGDKVNIVDFTATTGGESSPFRFRLKFNSFEDAPSDGLFGDITRGTMTFSFPRQNNPEVPYVKGEAYPGNYIHGPALGEKVSFQAREIGCNLFEVHWKETKSGATTTHVEDFTRQHVCTNITNINRVPIPAGFDPLDIENRLDDTQLFPDGNPAASDDFPFFNLCGTMSQSRESDRVWEDDLHNLVYVAP